MYYIITDSYDTAIERLGKRRNIAPALYNHKRLKEPPIPILVPITYTGHGQSSSESENDDENIDESDANLDDNRSNNSNLYLSHEFFERFLVNANDNQNNDTSTDSNGNQDPLSFSPNESSEEFSSSSRNVCNNESNNKMFYLVHR